MNRESLEPGIESGIVRAGPSPVQPVQKAEAERRSSYKKRSRESPLFLWFYLYYKSFQQNYSQSIGINKKGERGPPTSNWKGMLPETLRL